MPQYNNKDDLAIAFKQATKNTIERTRILSIYPELKNAIAFYEKHESYFIANGSLSKYGHVVLKALKENVYFQIQEEGIASFDETAKTE